MLALFMDNEWCGVDLSFKKKTIVFKMKKDNEDIMITETQDKKTKFLKCQYTETDDKLYLYCNNIYEYIFSKEDCILLNKFDGVIYQCCQNFSLTI